MVLPLLIGAGAALGGALISSNATKKATQASTAATDQQIALEREQMALAQQQYEQQRQTLAPYVAAGEPGINALTGRLADGAGTFGNTADPSYQAPGAFSFTEQDYKASPAYQVQLREGINAIDSSMARRGALNSGATIKAIQSFGQDLAAQDFGNERAFAYGQYGADRSFGRGNYESDRNYLTGRYDQQTGVAGELATIGGNAAAGVGNAGSRLVQAGQNMAGNVGNALQANANTQANAGLVGASNINSLIGQGLTAYMGNGGMRAAAYTPPKPQYNAGNFYGIGGY
jgi:hypothetical protein